MRAISTRLIPILFGLAACLPASAEEQVSSSGTAFYINELGWLVTNAHVLEDCERAVIAKAGLVVERQLDVQNDLAAVRIESTGSKPLLIRRAPPRLGEDIAAFGYPLNGVLSDSVKVTTGNVNALVGIDNDTRYLQVSTPIQPGNSGGPVVDRSGQLIAVTTASLGAKFAEKSGILPQNINFAARASVLDIFLQSRGIAFGVAEGGNEQLPTADLAEAVAPSVAQLLCISSQSVSQVSQRPLEAAPTVSDALWAHNGSTMSVVTNGTRLEIRYVRPRSGMTAVGVKSGQLLFSGAASDGILSGTAFIFNKRCGPLSYEVSGWENALGSEIVLMGQAPKVSAQCKRVGSVADRLVFTKER